MAKCDLRVVLDEPNRTFEPGERVTGRVIVDVDKTVQCDGLTVTHKWKTHGRGNTESGAARADTLFVGEWEPGRYEYEFDFQQPPGPESYHGHNLNVDWYVHAAADIPWALDPDAETDHLMRYKGALDDYRVGNPATIASAGQQQQGCGGCLAAFGGVFLAAGLFTIVTTWSSGNFESAFVGLIFSAVGGFIAWSGVSKYLAREKLGEVSVELSPTHVHPGDEVRCIVTITPPKPLEINGIECTLTAAEVVVRGSGTNKKTYTHELHEELRVERWESSKTLQPGTAHTFEQVFSIPEGAVPSFDSGDDNKLEWAIETEVDIPNWPDWSTRNVLIVVPGHSESASDTAASGGSEAEKPDDWW